MVVQKKQKLKFRIGKQEALDLLLPLEELSSVDVESIQLDPSDQSYIVIELVETDAP